LNNEVKITNGSGTINISGSVVGNNNTQNTQSTDPIVSYSQQLIEGLTKLTSFFANQPKPYKQPVDDLLETIENTQQRLQGLSQAPLEEQQRVRERLSRLQGRIHALELQSAQFGIYTPPYVIEDLKRAKTLAEELQALLPPS
jgi:TolA-binding protein